MNIQYSNRGFVAVQKVAIGWQVDVQPEGRVGRRVRKICLTKAEALRFELFIKAEAAKGKPWNPEPTDARALSELVGIWYELHGRHLKDGEARKRKLEAMVVAFVVRLERLQLNYQRGRPRMFCGIPLRVIS